MGRMRVGSVVLGGRGADGSRLFAASGSLVSRGEVLRARRDFSSSYIEGCLGVLALVLEVGWRR